MLSFPKLLILVVVAIAAWHLFRKPAPRPPARAGGRNDAAPPEPTPPPLPAETMRRCTTCGAYAAAACDRADCGFARSPRN